MAKVDKQKGIFEEEEEEEEEQKPVIELSSDDEEANEDLSLKVVEKALLMRAAKLAQNDNDGVVLDVHNDSGVVFISSGRDDDVSRETEVVVVKEEFKKKRRKKKKTQKTQLENQSVVTVEQEEVEKVETVEKANGHEEKEAVDIGEALDAAPVGFYQDVVTCAVEVPENMVLRKLLRGPRYFDPPGSSWSTCYNCGKEGHMAVNCPSFEKKKRPCFLCGSLGHGVKQCSKERVCIICKSVGHRPNKCPEKHKGGPQNSKVCLKCGDSGHDMFSCENDYSFDDLKDIQCYICKNVGHLCCVNSVDNSPREVSCYKCGELGHTGLECARLHEEASTAASSSSCFKCGEAGHFARECTSSGKAGKRNHEPSTPVLKSHRKNKEYLGFKSAPQDLGKSRKKRKSKSEDRSNTTPKKSKQRGGWLTEDPGDFSQSKSKKNRRRSPSTPSLMGHKNPTLIGGHGMSSSQSSNRMYKNHTTGMSSSPSYWKMQNNNHWGTSAPQGSASPFHHRFSASRFNNSGSAGFRGNYNWW